MGPRQLSRLFRAELGSSAATYVELTRIDIARRLLEDSSAPLKTIAYATDRLPAEPLRTNMVKEAVARTVGQWRRGKIGYRAVHTQPYSRTGSGYGNYILKHVTRRDDRMGDHRVAFSKSMKAGTREFWLAVSGLDGTRKVPRNARRVARNSFAGKIVHARRATRKRVSARVSESSRLRHAIKRLAKAAQAASTSS